MQDPLDVPAVARTHWRPRLGAWIEDRAVRFRVWAPAWQQVELVLDPNGPAERRRALAREGEGSFTGRFEDIGAGDRYACLLDGKGPYPDPASRYQPEGVHGPSVVVDPGAFGWSDGAWRGLPLAGAVIYELHIGSFTAARTFAGVVERLPYLADLGVTALELMPVAEFPGTRNWGYDGAALFAPSHNYGAPDDLRRLVNVAHGLGLAVFLDVVYNHFGPDGAYAPLFSPFYLSNRQRSPWGAAVNFEDDHAHHVRAFFIENALHWLHEYHIDGLRLDATHALVDNGPIHFLRELATAVRGSDRNRSVLLIAEDDRNLATIVKASEEGGWGLDAVWADDFHHQVRRLSAGDRDGYYQDYSGSLVDLSTTLRQGWFYTGQHSAYRGAPRGTGPAGVPLERMIICLQNHDQIGNRPLGTRLNHQIEPALFRALSALLLFAPETPLLFMGQEWAASTPFLFFTDHAPDLGRQVTEGRRREFARFEAFLDEAVRERIPDPQAPATFAASCLEWDERDREPHAGMLALYRALLWLRRSEPALQRGSRFEVDDLEGGGLALTRATDAGDTLLLIDCLIGPGTFDASRWRATTPGSRWTVVLTTEEARFLDATAAAPQLEIELERGPVVTFHRPGALILRQI